MTPLFMFALVLLGFGTAIGYELGDAGLGFLVSAALLAYAVYKLGETK